MATFASWLKGQDDRQDETGWLARAWAEDRGHGTIRSPAGMRQHVLANWGDDAPRALAAIDAAVAERDGQGATVTAIRPQPGPEANDARQWAERAAEGRKAPPAAGPAAEPADALDEHYRRVTGREPPPYEPEGYRDADREQAVSDSRRLVWIELAMRMILGPRAAEIDGVMDAAMLPETDLVAAFAQADLQP